MASATKEHIKGPCVVTLIRVALGGMAGWAMTSIALRGPQFLAVCPSAAGTQA